MQTFWKRILAALGVGATVAVAAVALAEPGIDVTFTQDQVRLTASWAPRCDVRGCPDSYAVTWLRGGTQVRQATTGARRDSVLVAPPAVGDSVRVEVRVQAIRRGQAGPVTSASRWIRLPDAPPPAVDSLRLDTLPPPSIDSVRISFYSPANGQPLQRASLLIRQGDSVLAVARYYGLVGLRRPQDTTRWSAVPASDQQVIRTRVIARGWRDSAYIVVDDCGCDASGNPRLHYDLRVGQWVLPDSTGGWRPVQVAQRE